MPTYYNEKTKKYYCKFYYTDWQGIRRQKKKEGFTLARDAKAYEQDFLNKAAGDCSMKFSALYENYIEDYKARRKPTSVYCREYAFKKHFLPVFGNMPLTAITPVTIRKWQNDIISAGYSATYQHALNAYLSAAFNYAVKYYKLKENPVKQAGAIGKSHAGRIDFWTLAEFNSFINTLQKSGSPFPKANINTDILIFAFTVLFYTGLRIGEFLALTVQDYNPAAQTLNINKTLAVLNREVIIQPPKTPKSKRVINLPAKLCAMFDNYIAAMYEPQPQERLFPMLNKLNLSKALKHIAGLAHIKPIRLHDLRHSHASMLIELNVSPLAISERLGHDDVKTTLNTYSHLYPNKGNELAKKINVLMP